MPGFGPLGARAATQRPAHTPDTYGAQTWFKNCSAPGASDGTVPDASWFNHMLAQFVYAAGQAGVTLNNDQSNDTILWQILQRSAPVAPGVVMSRSTPLSVPHNTPVIPGNYDFVSANTFVSSTVDDTSGDVLISADEAGWYVATFNAQFTAVPIGNSNYAVTSQLLVNGVFLAHSIQRMQGGSGTIYMTSTAPIRLGPGDLVSGRLFQDSGNALNCASCVLSMVRVGR